MAFDDYPSLQKFDIFEANIDEPIIQCNPLFHNLLENLSQYAKSSIITNSQFLQAQESYNYAKVLYFEHLLFMNALLEVIANHQGKYPLSRPMSCLCHSKGAFYTLQQQLEIGLSSKHINKEDTDFESINYFGLNQAFFEQHFSTLDKKIVHSFLLPNISNGIHKLSKSVLQFYGQETNDKLVFAKIAQLPKTLKPKQDNMKLVELMIYKDKKKISKQMQQYSKILVQLVCLMRNMFEYCEMDSKFSLVLANLYKTKCEGLYLKIRASELQILRITYDEQSILCLQKIRQELLQKESETDREIQKKNALLKNFESVGQSFNVLVKEYTTLMDSIEKEKWMLNELTKVSEQLPMNVGYCQ